VFGHPPLAPHQFETRTAFEVWASKQRQAVELDGVLIRQGVDPISSWVTLHSGRIVHELLRFHTT
jgi:hypothetical protein